jgi:hypothetical protein
MHDVNDIYFNRVIINQCAEEREKGKQAPHNNNMNINIKSFLLAANF